MPFISRRGTSTDGMSLYASIANKGNMANKGNQANKEKRDVNIRVRAFTVFAMFAHLRRSLHSAG